MSGVAHLRRCFNKKVGQKSGARPLKVSVEIGLSNYICGPNVFTSVSRAAKVITRSFPYLTCPEVIKLFFHAQLN